MTNVDCQVGSALDLALRNAPKLPFPASNEWHPYRAATAVDMNGYAMHLTEKGLLVDENHFGRNRLEDVDNQAGRVTMPLGQSV